MNGISMRPAESPPLKVKCLLVDDLEDNLFALSLLLRSDEVEIHEARSGREALELLLIHEFALALLDVQMPGMDGFELAELMRGSERTRDVPIIFVTAGASDQLRLFKGYERGAVDFLYKPIAPHILLNKAAVFFQLHRQKQLLARELHERSQTLRFNETFTASLGHDLRDPLGVILTSAAILQRISQDKLVQDTAERILSSGKRMNRLINDLQDLARARLAGGIVLHRAAVDIGELVDRAIAELQTTFPKRSMEVESCGDLSGWWDADRLIQVASNLIGNALQHGVPVGTVKVHLDGSAANGVSLTVANDGGIDAGLVPHVFDPFRSGVKTSRASNGPGLGLGLYIVQQIVVAHGGYIEVLTESDDGAGDKTQFRAWLPRREDAPKQG